MKKELTFTDLNYRKIHLSLLLAGKDCSIEMKDMTFGIKIHSIIIPISELATLAQFFTLASVEKVSSDIDLG